LQKKLKKLFIKNKKLIIIYIKIYIYIYIMLGFIVIVCISPCIVSIIGYVLTYHPIHNRISKNTYNKKCSELKRINKDNINMENKKEIFNMENKKENNENFNIDIKKENIIDNDYEIEYDEWTPLSLP
jgi:hypothetical protein